MLMDFGTGKELDDSSSSDLTGTPLYLAPEVLAGRPATVQSDIYSLGVLLYHLVTGAYPVRGRTIRDVRRAHERHERVALRTSRPDVRPALARVIERAMRSTAGASLRERRCARARPGRSAAPSGHRAALRTGLAAAAAVLLVAVLAVEVRARRTGDHRGLGTRLASLFAGAPSSVEQPVIAVLPFKNFSSEPGQRPAGRTASRPASSSSLAIIDGLQVKSQHSSFMLKDKPRDWPTSASCWA